MSKFQEHFGYILWMDVPRYVRNAGNLTKFSLIMLITANL